MGGPWNPDHGGTQMRGMLGTVLFSVVAGVPVAVAAEAAGCDPTVEITCVTAGGDAFTPAGGTSTPGAPQGAPIIGQPVGQTPKSRFEVVATAVAPACSGNSPASPELNCSGASTICPVAAETAFWVWHQIRDNSTGVVSIWQRVNNPAYLCLGPTDARLPAAVAIDGLVQRDFKTLVVLRGSTRVEPSPQTLVNLATTFTTDAPVSYEIRTTILGRGVTITAKAQQYRWFFGDADAATGRPSVSHVYAKAGGVAPYVVIVWGGTFTIAGDPTVRQVLGTATTTGPGTPIRVREVRSQYEAG